MPESGASMSCAELARTCDWSSTDYGPRQRWSPTVETMLRLLLESPVPMCYCHGPRYAIVYNDPFARMLGDKHPGSWARPAQQVVPEVWEQPRVAAAFDQVMTTGEPFFEDGTLLTLERLGDPGAMEDAYFVRGYSPVRDEEQRILGMLIVAVESTEAVARVRTVAGLASALASAVSVDDVVRVGLRHAVDGLGVEEATFCLPERRFGGWRVTGRRRGDVVSEDEERLPLIWSSVEPGTDLPVVRAAETRTSRRVEGRPVVLPLSAAGVHGAVSFTLAASAASGLEHAVLTTCSELVSEALARARLYDTERRTADLLQRTLLPELLPHRPGVSLAVRYQPVTTGTAAGGDFYDVFEVPDGRLAVVIGDVVGRGVAAATVMGQVRAAARGAALAVPDAHHVFGSLDQLVASLDEMSSLPLGAYAHRSADPLAIGVHGELFVTMLYCLLETDTGRVTMASAGHFPPVLMRRANGTGRTVDFADMVVGPPLGVPGNRPEAASELGEGDALFAFTDGLLERRDRDLVAGEAVLLDALAGAVSFEPRSICQQVIDALVGPQQLEDDCALLALVRTHTAHRTASVVIPPLAPAVRRTRMWVEEQLGRWGAAFDVTWVAVMGVSELVTNVLLHAATDARVTLDLSPDRLLVTVADTGTRGAPARTTGDVTATRGRGLGLVAEIAHTSGFERNVAGSTVWFEVLVGEHASGGT